ncbi:hypothetical protein ACFQ15_05800 [Sphingomonas hankookensis]|uniref:hypothetical protein n=1 Tax=Sphingomonas hankookensis TaxID=563996 RepID=UPI001F5A48E3|nr:hypothetical protein [Sphingomonas hankookensis]
MSDSGNSAQVRMVAEQVADAAITRFHQQQAPMKAEIPAPLKWAGALAVAVATAGIVALCLWVVSTLSQLQQTVTRIDERQQINGPAIGGRLDKIEERLSAVERTGHSKGAGE